VRPGREPAGYRDRRNTPESEIIFHPAKLRTAADWITAGQNVFESEPLLLPPRSRRTPTAPCPRSSPSRDPSFAQGPSPNSCAGCHTRLPPDGSVVPGAPGMVNFSASEESPRALQEHSWILFGAPWIESKEIYFARLTKEAVVQRLAHSGDCQPSASFAVARSTTTLPAWLRQRANPVQKISFFTRSLPQTRNRSPARR
jgi:hypothetical protein